MKNTTTRAALWAATGGLRLFWNRVGTAWQGKAGASHLSSGRQGPTVVQELIGAKSIDTGLDPGSLELVGWEPVTITAEMVGQTIARTVSATVRLQSYTEMTPEQKAWCRDLLKAGGRILIVRETAEGEFQASELTRGRIAAETASTRAPDRGRSTIKVWIEASKADAGTLEGRGN